MRYHLAIVGLVILTLTACGDDGDPSSSPPPDTSPAASQPASSQPQSLTNTATGAPAPTGEPGSVSDFVTGLDVPWDVAILPDDTALLTSRDSAEVIKITKGGRTSVVGTVPGVAAGSEGGLLGLAIAPDATATEATLYVYLTTSDDNRILRMPYSAKDGLGDPDVILDGLERGSRHQGGRMIFGPDGMLYVGVGDAGIDHLAQERDSLNGKILRMRPNGKAPPDNPFNGSLVYSWGHRNVQGLAFDEDGRLWASEFGDRLRDELNLIEPGANYGWPIHEGFDDGDPDYVDPQVEWLTSDASPSGIAYHDGSIYMATLQGQNVFRIPIDDDGAGEPEVIFDQDFGRLRHVEVAPDGALWVLTNNTDGRGGPLEGDDRILRYVPQS